MTRLDSATAVIASARRAAAADRQSAMHFEVELRPLSALSSITEDWRALAARTLQPNVFYEPAFAIAAAPVLGADVRVGLVWSDARRQLVGVFPVRVEQRRYGMPFTVIVGWTHPFAPFGVPLVDRDLAEPVINAWLDHVAQDAALPKLMLLPLIAENGSFATTLATVLARRGCEIKAFDRHVRPLLQPGDARTNYFEQCLGGKRARGLRRRQRRLAEIGAVAVVEAKGGDTLIHARDDFLALEAAGWKGRRGTAATNNAEIHRFMQEAVAGLGREGKVLIHRLKLNDKVIAATMALRSGDTVWGWKVAYNEAYAEYSPGILAVAGLTESLLAERTIAQTDSCATPDDTMAPQLWNERIAIADWLFPVSAGGGFALAMASQLERLRRTASVAVKSVRDHLRGG